jgi:inosose dehydratase
VSTRIAGAPVSWGVIEIPDWGYQMPADRVLKEASSLGLSAVEAGPEGLLPSDPSEVSDLLARYDLKLVGGFVPAVLHEPGVREEQLELVGRRARFFAAAGADVVVLAVMSGSDDFGPFVEIGDDAWGRLFESLKTVEEICGRHGIAVSMHHHYGTVIEGDDQLKRFLEGSGMGLCLDTGHLAIGGSDPVEIAELAGGRVNHVHLKDVDRGGGGQARQKRDRLQAGRAGARVPASGRGRREVAEVLDQSRTLGLRGMVRTGAGHRGRDRAGRGRGTRRRGAQEPRLPRGEAAVGRRAVTRAMEEEEPP